MTELVTAWMLGCVTGFFMGVTLAGRRRPTCREMMRDPDRQPTFAALLMPKHGEPEPPELFTRLNEGRVQRGNGGNNHTTPKPNIISKPQPPPGRIIDASGRTIGYRPLPWVQGPTNPPPRNP
jgi:hypothetical protein